jgi:hypothetical protein
MSLYNELGVIKMTNMEKENNEKANPSREDILKNIRDNVKAASHHEEAAKYHRDAVTHLEAGDHEQALESVIKAQEHQAKASEYHREVMRFHGIRG